jgi:NitT/TauT family transport system substrate-binding protein
MTRRAILCVALVAALAAGAGADEPVRLDVATMAGDASAEVFYGIDRGFFRAQGLDVHVTVMNNVAAQAAAVASGAVVVGNGGVGSIAVARQHGILESVIAPASIYEAKALTAALMVARDSPITSAAQLNGRTIGTNGLQDQAQLETQLWLEKHGANVETIHFVEVPFPEMAAALTQHRIDAALMVEPLITAHADEVRRLGDAMGAISDDFITTGWFASDAWIAAHPDLAARFVRGMIATAVWANAHHADSARILIDAAHLDPDIAGRMTRSTYGTTLDPKAIQPVLDMFHHFGVLATPMPAQSILWSASPASLAHP